MIRYANQTFPQLESKWVHIIWQVKLMHKEYSLANKFKSEKCWELIKLLNLDDYEIANLKKKLVLNHRIKQD